MAKSPAHQFGQIIGDTLEAAIEPLLCDLAKKHGLYLDKKGKRPARSGTKVSWTDRHGNKHDLDFVLERGGTAESIGVPVAFVETAWRRYTKHSRNKAQEIQGAILPLSETHSLSSPFLGVILAGDFTEGALKQLNSSGFVVLHAPYDTIKRAFARCEIDAGFVEETSEREFRRKVAQWKKLSAEKRQSVATALFEGLKQPLREFQSKLEAAISRQLTSIRVLPLHGTATQLNSVSAAISFIQDYSLEAQVSGLQRFEIEVRFSNGDVIAAQFAQRNDAIAFLRSFAMPTSEGEKSEKKRRK